MSLIELKEVLFKYKEMEEPALKNLNLSIEAGEFVSIIGSNGSGKSTLAKLLNVLLLPTEGLITINGLDTTELNNKWEIRQNIGMVFQNPDNQLVATTIENDVAFGPENLGIPGPEIRKRVDKALTMVGMDGFQQHSPYNLSGGQKQRVAIAGVIAMEPSCLVLDEPTAMLDPKGREEVMNTISYLNKEKNITIIHITHFMEEACQAEKVFVMHEGQISKQGKPLNVFSDMQTLKEINLDVPVSVELAEYLRENGVEIPPVINMKELVDFICKLS